MNEPANDRGLPPQPWRFMLWLVVAIFLVVVSRLLMLIVIIPVAWIAKTAGVALPVATLLAITMGWFIVPVAMIWAGIRRRGLRAALWFVYAAFLVEWVGEVLLKAVGVQIWSGHSVYAGQDFGAFGFLTPAVALGAALAYAWARWGVPVPRRRAEQARPADGVGSEQQESGAVDR